MESRKATRGLTKDTKMEKEGHQGAHEGHQDGEEGGVGDGNDGSVLGDGHAADGLTVSGVGAAGEESANHGADAVAQQGLVQARILGQVLLDDGGQVLVVGQVLDRFLWSARCSAKTTAATGT